MADRPILRGMATISFFADDVVAARKWYSDLLGAGRLQLTLFVGIPYLSRHDTNAHQNKGVER
jgi:hypothetical protein